MIAKRDKIFLEQHSMRLSFAVSLLDDYSKGKPIGRIDMSLKEYLFSWDNVPGKDSERLLRFLKDDLDIGWAENAYISKSSDGMIISISKGVNSAEIIMDEKKKKATLKISDGKTLYLKVKEENGKLNIYLKEIKEKPIKNLSSYYLFLDLPDDSYTVQVKYDYYFDEDSEPIRPADLDPKNPVVDITLKPKSSYPFPPRATLIRGVVKNTDGHVVANAGITAKILTPEENKSAEIVEDISAGASSIR